MQREIRFVHKGDGYFRAFDEIHLLRVRDAVLFARRVGDERAAQFARSDSHAVAAPIGLCGVRRQGEPRQAGYEKDDG